MRNLFFVLIAFQFTTTFGQSKKEQIFDLSQRIDSLNIILNNERNYTLLIKFDLENQILKQNKSIDSMSIVIKKTNDELAYTLLELDSIKQESNLKSLKIDSLYIVLTDISDSLIKAKDELMVFSKKSNHVNSKANKHTEAVKEIYFEGIILFEHMYDYAWWYDVEITNGELKGKKESIYFSTIMNDPHRIESKGNVVFDGSDVAGKRIKGKIIRSVGDFENYNDGSIDTKKCYRPIELDWL